MKRVFEQLCLVRNERTAQWPSPVGGDVDECEGHLVSIVATAWCLSENEII